MLTSSIRWRSERNAREPYRSFLRLPCRRAWRLRNRNVGVVMTTQQVADQLLAQWQLLWPLPAAERIKRIDEIRADLEFEEALSLVTKEMESA